MLKYSTFEKELDKAKRRLKSNFDLILYNDTMLNLMRTYFNENLKLTSNDVFNEVLAQNIIQQFNAYDLKIEHEMSEIFIRKHLCDLMRFYLSSINKSTMIHVKDKKEFEIQLKMIGLNLDFRVSPVKRSLTADGNVLVLSGLLLTCLVVIGSLFNKYSKT